MTPCGLQSMNPPFMQMVVSLKDPDVQFPVICDSCGALNIKCGLAGKVPSLEKEKFREKGKGFFIGL